MVECEKYKIVILSDKKELIIIHHFFEILKVFDYECHKCTVEISNKFVWTE